MWWGLVEVLGFLFLFCFLVTTLKFSSLRKFRLYSTVLSTLVTRFCIRFSDLIHHIAESLNSFTNLCLFSPPSSPWQRLFLKIFIYLFMAVLGLRFCARAFSSCGKRGPLLIAVRGSLTIAASLVAEHRLQTRRLSSCGSRAQLLHGMWDPHRPGLEPVSPALAGGFSTTVPPGKPLATTFYSLFLWVWLFI